ncbi:CGNR zinc finger domain-containing protein [Streptomyces sp. SS1-1]|uniref:CGNR zinc finger domain-containing protein n=1 Tax=Streptomyces sp. SS1-1 TaxID=2651869 RepID=UPI00124F9222|nr:CGNR zinc finger domain-containing protein [Streptomyces sp. SS1-1]KAB2976559.1 CGNR zinc finger domain-containing protein [Streptomyces sp. SS1-1]
MEQDTLVELLNSTPVVDGTPEDLLADPEAARAWQREHGGSGTPAERRHLVEARDLLQRVVRGDAPATALGPLLEGVTSHPRVDADGVTWEPRPPTDRRLAVEAVLAWGAIQETMPGRLRPCANEECRRFLLDRSKTNKGRWCSMALCGNRMKARRHYERTRQAAAHRPD